MTAQAGVPAARLLVPLSGELALAGGLSIAVGYKAKLGAWLLVVFLIPVTVTARLLGRRRPNDARDTAGDVHEERGDARWRPADRVLRLRSAQSRQPGLITPGHRNSGQVRPTRSGRLEADETAAGNLLDR